MVSIFFFVITFGMLLVTFIGYFALPLSMFYRFHMALISDKQTANPKLKILPKKAPRKRYARTLQRVSVFNLGKDTNLDSNKIIGFFNRLIF